MDPPARRAATYLYDTFHEQCATFRLPRRGQSPVDRFLEHGDKVALGTPLVAGASVTAKVVSHGRGDKVHIFKMRRRKHYRKSQGHRQNYTEIEILGIAG